MMHSFIVDGVDRCASASLVQTPLQTFSQPHWDLYRIGWAVSFVCAIATVFITVLSVRQHCRSYTNPSEQRQIIRILYMPPVYAVISFLSYRFFRHYTYYELIQVVYEAVTLSAFLLLLIEYVASTASGHNAQGAIARKDKRPLPMPFSCFQYRPNKPYFMYTLKWSVLQYVIIRPACSIAGIICEALGVLCTNAGFNPHYAYLYISLIDFISISIALYGLLVFYGLTAEELQGRRPLAKFLCIKLVVMCTFYQTFIFSALEDILIHDTQYWSKDNIIDASNAVAICVEMVLFALMFWWAYPAAEYRRIHLDEQGEESTVITRSVWKPIWDSINYADFALEIIGSLRFFADYFKGIPTAHGTDSDDPPFLPARMNLRKDEQGVPKPTFGQVFQVDYYNEGRRQYVKLPDEEDDALAPTRVVTSSSSESSSTPTPRPTSPQVENPRSITS